MPLFIGVILATVFLVVRVIARLVLELGRRLRRVYRVGYALVPDDTLMGANFSQMDRSNPLWAANDPLFLDGFGADSVAQVHDVGGVRARARDLGRFWRCKSFVVGSVFPGWAALGPNGTDALGVLSSVWDIPIERIEGTTYPTRRRMREAVVSKDSYRATIAWKVDSLVEATVLRRLEDIVAAGRESITPDETRTLALARRSPAWASASAVVADGMIAAALADELPPATVSRLAADWVALVEQEPDPTIKGVRGTERVKQAFAAVPGVVGDHPTLAAILTCGVLGVAVTISPNFAGILLIGLALLLGWLVLRDLPRVWREIRRRGRGVRPRRPRPTEWLGSAPSPGRLRTAMDSISDGPDPILINRLVRLLAESTVWVGLDGPAPVRPERDLDWRRRTGQPLLLAIAIGEGGERSLQCFTDEGRHRADRGHTHVAWTTQLPFPEVIRLAQERELDMVLVDPFRVPALSISREAFPALLHRQEHEENQAMSEGDA